MTLWRFDQGRLGYFQFDEIKRIATALAKIDGIKKPSLENDVLRDILSNFSSRPFAPTKYTVWRNYKRVFGCLLLATEIGGRIVCTELCKQLAEDDGDIDVDDYLRHFSVNYSYPSPVFQGYNTREKQVFPVVAILKLLISRFLFGSELFITTHDVAQLLIANDVSGLESIETYPKLKPKKFHGDFRQPRELMRFVSQFSFLKWNNPNLFLEVDSKEDSLEILKTFEPQVSVRQEDGNVELLQLGSKFQGMVLSELTISKMNPIDTEFTEGSKIRVAHLRTERSAKLKEFYFASKKNPHVCDMCAMDTVQRYPWVDRLIELHHLLPLSSPVKVETRKTSIKDIVGVCPSCHRATHKFYGKWLGEKGRKDFEGDKEAKDVYKIAKGKIFVL